MPWTNRDREFWDVERLPRGLLCRKANKTIQPSAPHYACPHTDLSGSTNIKGKARGSSVQLETTWRSMTTYTHVGSEPFQAHGRWQHCNASPTRVTQGLVVPHPQIAVCSASWLTIWKMSWCIHCHFCRAAVWLLFHAGRRGRSCLVSSEHQLNGKRHGCRTLPVVLG